MGDRASAKLKALSCNDLSSDDDDFMDYHVDSSDDDQEEASISSSTPGSALKRKSQSSLVSSIASKKRKDHRNLSSKIIAKATVPLLVAKEELAKTQAQKIKQEIDMYALRKEKEQLGLEMERNKSRMVLFQQCKDFVKTHQNWGKERILKACPHFDPVIDALLE